MKIDLTKSELKVLRCILAHTGGNEKNSPRKIANRILVKLNVAGIGWDDNFYDMVKEGLEFHPYRTISRRRAKRRNRITVV